MILPFSTQINGKPTYFVEKIWKGLKTLSPESHSKIIASVSPGEQIKQFPVDIDVYKEVKQKIHTIREDKNDRWQPGVMIDFFINARQKNMFRFAPRIPVVSTQKIFMTYLPHLGNGFEVSVDGKHLYKDTIEKIAINDGFESFEEFRDYFISQMKDDSFSGKIIHWTDLKY